MPGKPLSPTGFTLLLAMLLLCAPASGLVINPTFVDGSGQSWSATRRGIINQAIDDWEAMILDSRTIDVTFTFDSAGAGTYLAQWSATAYVAERTDIYPWTSGVDHTVAFNTYYFTGDNYLWWDSTPATDDDLPFVAWDALTIARHELAHMLGFTDGLYVDDFAVPAETDRWAELVTGSTFDAGGLNVPLESSFDISHVADSGITSGDLMTAALLNGERIGISSLDLEMLSLAHSYSVLPPPAGDFNGDWLIDGNDFDLWVSTFANDGSPGKEDLRADGNGDGQVTHADYVLWANHVEVGAAALMPEPATAIMLALGALAAMGVQRRRRPLRSCSRT